MYFGGLKIDRKWTVVGVLVILAAVYVFLLAAKNKKDPQLPPAELTDENGEAVAPAALYGQANLLFYCRDDRDAAVLLSVDADLTGGRIAVSALPDDKEYALNGVPVTIGTIYAAGGLEGVKAAADARFGVDYSRAVICTPRQFISITEALGDVTVFAGEEVNYADESIAANITPGENTLTGEELYVYLRSGAEGEALYRLQSETFALMLKAYLTPENIENGEELFNRIVNSSQTDITAYDYAACADRLSALASSDTVIYIGTGMIGEDDSAG